MWKKPYLGSFFFFFLLSSFVLSVHSQSASSDASVMQDLKKSLKLPSSLNWTDSNPCNWDNVGCANDGRGNPDPNRSPKPSRHPPLLPVQPHRVNPIRGHVQPTQRGSPESRRVKLAPARFTQQQQLLLFPTRFLHRFNFTPRDLHRLQPFCRVGNTRRLS